MRRAQTYRAPGSPGWLAWAIQNNIAPPARLELEVEPEPDPPAVEPAGDLGPLDPAVWTWQADVGMNPQAETAPSPPAVPIEPIREPIDLDSGSAPAPAIEAWPVEEACRRPGWRCDGGWIRMADGLLWAVPMIDLDHLIRFPALRNTLADVRTMDLGPKLNPFSGPDDVQEAAARMIELHNRMGLLGAALFSLNYSMDPADVARLALVPDPMDWCETLTRAVDGLGLEAVALCVARGVPVCWD